MKTKKMKTVALILAITTCFSGIVPAKADTRKADDKKWASAYQKTVKKLNKEDPNGQSEDLSDVSNMPYAYDLIYFNDDSIPELVASLNGYWVSMYTYDSEQDKVYQVVDQWGYGAMGNVGYEYLPKKNFLRNYNSDFAGAVRYANCSKMEKHKMISLYPKELRTENYTDKNKNGIPDEGEYTDKTTYYYGNKKISAKKYASYTKASKKLKWIAGTMTYKQILKKLKSAQV